MLSNQDYEILVKSKKQLEDNTIAQVKAAISMGALLKPYADMLNQTIKFHNELCIAHQCKELCVKYVIYGKQ